MMSRTHSYKINIIDMNILSLISRYSSTSPHQNTDNYPQYISNRYDFIQLLNLGNTHENRTIFGVKIGAGEEGGDTPSVLIDGGMHAREWITVSTALNGKEVL